MTSNNLKPILNFPGYSITRDGRVWSSRPCRGTSGRWLKPRKINKYGHLSVLMSREKKEYQRLVHRLVLEAFAGPCPEGMQCRHLDGNPGNNSLENLKWGTPKENSEDTLRHGTISRGVQNGKSTLDEDDVRLVRVWLKHGYTQEEIAEAFGVMNQTVSKIKTGKLWVWLKNLDGE